MPSAKGAKKKKQKGTTDTPYGNGLNDAQLIGALLTAGMGQGSSEPNGRRKTGVKLQAWQAARKEESELSEDTRAVKVLNERIAKRGTISRPSPPSGREDPTRASNGRPGATLRPATATRDGAIVPVSPVAPTSSASARRTFTGTPRAAPAPSGHIPTGSQSEPSKFSPELAKLTAEKTQMSKYVARKRALRNWAKAGQSVRLAAALERSAKLRAEAAATAAESATSPVEPGRRTSVAKSPATIRATMKRRSTMTTLLATYRGDGGANVSMSKRPEPSALASRGEVRRGAIDAMKVITDANLRDQFRVPQKKPGDKTIAQKNADARIRAKRERENQEKEKMMGLIKSELRKQLKNCALQTGDESWVKLFSAYDTDGSGTISATEWILILRVKLRISNKKMSDADLDMFFHRIDEDGNGELSIRELCSYLIVERTEPAAEDKIVVPSRTRPNTAPARSSFPSLSSSRPRPSGSQNKGR